MGELKMNAYYYSFEPTGVQEIDEILSAVAVAGKGSHHTESWDDPDYADKDGKTDVDKIQEAANRAAKLFNNNHPTH